MSKYLLIDDGCGLIVYQHEDKEEVLKQLFELNKNMERIGCNVPLTLYKVEKLHE